ncbi:MAG: HAD-IIB family hydrolase [Sandaracinaceae bacterium]
MMEPLDPAALRAIAPHVRGVAFDLDDTFITHGTLTSTAFACLERLRALGLRLALVTGRPLGWTDAFAAIWPIEVAVGENGAGWAKRRDGHLEVGYYADDATRETQRAALDRLRAEVRSRLPSLSEAGDQPGRRCDVAWEIAGIDATMLDALVSLIERAGMAVSVSSVHAHAAPGDWDKPGGLIRALNETTEDVKARWLFVGDSGNDAAAFAFFDHTVGVANVRAHLGRLPVPPRWITNEPMGAGFVELVDGLERARG